MLEYWAVLCFTKIVLKVPSVPSEGPNSTSKCLHRTWTEFLPGSTQRSVKCRNSKAGRVKQNRQHLLL